MWESKNVLVLVALDLEIPLVTWEFDCNIQYTGIGKVNAAITTTRAILDFKPELIVNLGTAGSVNVEPGQSVTIGSVLERDFDCNPIQIRGSVPFDDAPREFISMLPGYICGSGDNFVTSLDPWFVAEGIEIIDMELFAIAKTAFKFDIPWVSFKYITDALNSTSESDWFAKLPEANVKLKDVFREKIVNTYFI